MVTIYAEEFESAAILSIDNNGNKYQSQSGPLIEKRFSNIIYDTDRLGVPLEKLERVDITITYSDGFVVTKSRSGEQLRSYNTIYDDIKFASSGIVVFTITAVGIDGTEYTDGQYEYPVAPVTEEMLGLSAIGTPESSATIPSIILTTESGTGRNIESVSGTLRKNTPIVVYHDLLRVTGTHSESAPFIGDSSIRYFLHYVCVNGQIKETDIKSIELFTSYMISRIEIPANTLQKNRLEMWFEIRGAEGSVWDSNNSQNFVYELEP